MRRAILASLALVMAATGAYAAEGAALYQKCIKCHGFRGDQKAMGWSQVIAGWPADRVEGALKGYREGTYGGENKDIMKGQAAPLSDEDIKALSEYVNSLKQHAPAGSE